MFAEFKHSDGSVLCSTDEITQSGALETCAVSLIAIVMAFDLSSMTESNEFFFLAFLRFFTPFYCPGLIGLL